MAYLNLPLLSLDSHNRHITERPGHKLGCYHNQIPSTSSDFVPFTLQFWPYMARVFVDLLCFLGLQRHLTVTVGISQNGHSSPPHKFDWHHITAIWWLCYKLNHSLAGRNDQFRRIFFVFVALLSLLRCYVCKRGGYI